MNNVGYDKILFKQPLRLDYKQKLFCLWNNLK